MTIKDILSKIRDEGITTVIFDFDNTIADILIDWGPWHKKIESVISEYESSIGIKTPTLPGQSTSVQLLQNEYMALYGQKLREKIIKINRNYELENAHGVHPIEKTISLIKMLSGVRLWIWSTNDSETVAKFTKELEIYDLFSEIITRDRVDFIKPNPDGFFKFAGADAKREEYLMIGNSKSDSGAAKASGIQYIDVTEFE